MKSLFTGSLTAFAFFVLAAVNVCQAQDIAVVADTCENVLDQESKASARVRASDKAAFKAVEDLAELKKYRTALDTHNFNLKVYRLVDNYLEDVIISVTKQDETQVCVEVKGYLPSEVVSQVFEEDEPALVVNQEPMALALEDEYLEEEAIAIPPKPQIVINNDIAYPTEDMVSIPVMSPDGGVLVPVAEVQDLRTKVFVDRTDFYNGTSTGGFFPIFEHTLNSKPGVKAIAEKNNPDYILKPKILKAKVDNINAETGRLQMVTALDLIDTASSETYTEHQNRFVLFNLTDDPQKTAAGLAKSLFEEGMAKLLPKIKPGETVASPLSSVITPN